MNGKADLAASIAQRLLNRTKKTGENHQTLLTSYCLERFLYRLGASDRRERFVLKGAMLLRLWSEQPYRATRDLDFLRLGDGAFEAIRNDLRAIVATPVAPDAVSFDSERIGIEPIRAEDEYAGARATLPARCGRARLSLQIDMGMGDAVWPEAQACTYPTLLDLPTASSSIVQPSPRPSAAPSSADTHPSPTKTHLVSPPPIGRTPPVRRK